MSWRFRKVFRRGPIQMSSSKRGLGWSVGISGFRFGVSPDGHRHLSIVIPRTGVYWYKNLDEKNQSSPPPQKKGNVNRSSIPKQIGAKSVPPEPWWKQ